MEDKNPDNLFRKEGGKVGVGGWRNDRKNDRKSGNMRFLNMSTGIRP